MKNGQRSNIDFRRAAAVGAGKLSAGASRVFGKGGGTALPGLVASRLDPDLVRELTAQLSQGSLLISGTNGKTTTARMLSTIMREAGFVPLRNRSGSNLMRGVASSLVHEANLTGNLSSESRSIGLFEVDEAALPEVLSTVAADTIVLLNLFRDQLDRYGEVATVARLWSGAISAISRETRLIVNADDPLVADVASAAACVTYFSIESAEGTEGILEHASDVKACPRCGGTIRYRAVFLGHEGDFTCSECGFTRPEAAIRAAAVALLGMTGSRFDLITPSGSVGVEIPLPGMYNVYNALAAAAAAYSYNVELDTIARALSEVTPAFGRMERLDIDGRTVVIALAKNPTGLNEVLRTIVEDGQGLCLMVMLSDNIADGRDVSWIWDADVELLGGRVASVVFAGTRAEDMALRFKYASVVQDAVVAWDIEKDTERAFKLALGSTPSGSSLYVVPTYTALLDIRNTLTRLGHVKAYWED